MTIRSANLGFSRMGAGRELKKALEAYWKGAISEPDLVAAAKELRGRHWRLQKEAGIEVVPAGDQALYDHVLDAAVMVNAVPARYGHNGTPSLGTYFAMARGDQRPGRDVVAMEMTKWFDTNYHYIVPEVGPGTRFALAGTRLFDHYAEAKATGLNARPVSVGPVTFLRLSKPETASFDARSLTDSLVAVYAEALGRLADAGAEWVQLDEPCLVTDLPSEWQEVYKRAYAALAKVARRPKMLVATYFGGLGGNLSLAASLPVEGLHIDLHRGRADAELACRAWPTDRLLSLGVVEGRNIWRTDLDAALGLLERCRDLRKGGPGDLEVAPSCSLLHCPVDLGEENKLDAELKSWLAFGRQKLAEVVALTKGLRDGRGAITAELGASAEARRSREASNRIHRPDVRARVAALGPSDEKRAHPYSQRANAQRARFRLPALPTTTIGSFPQTGDVRAARARLKKGEWTQAQYDGFLEDETRQCVKQQETLGIDVLVHGEFERNDMVEYFGEQLDGFAFTQNGWVQSYGSRCVKPPILFGDVHRPHPMTVRWSAFAQSLTKRPMKGMLTGPVTILQWSFVREDVPRSEVALQVALALRDEVRDLEAGGIGIVQIDEPAIREGLPLREVDREAYRQWSVRAFRVSSAGAKDETQVHTHMCYSEFNEMLPSIAAMDADVISIESSRSKGELLVEFEKFKYPNEIGPGVYDIHSPRVPPTDEMVEILRHAARVLRREQLWVNPDCGLKTRTWDEVNAALRNMVEAAKRVREETSK